MRVAKAKKTTTIKETVEYTVCLYCRNYKSVQCNCIAPVTDAKDLLKRFENKIYILAVRCAYAVESERQFYADKANKEIERLKEFDL